MSNVINEIFKFLPHLAPSYRVNYFYELSPSYPNYPTQNDTLELVSRLLDRDFVNYRKPYGYL